MTQQFTQQMGTHSRDWGNRSGAGIGYALAPAETQGGDRVVAVGENVQGTGSLARLLTLLPNLPGGIAILARHLSHSNCSLRTSRRRLSNRRRAGASPLSYRLVATNYSCRAIRSGCGTLLSSIGHKLGGYRADLLEVSHLERLSFVSVAYDRNQTTKALAHGSILLPREQND